MNIKIVQVTSVGGNSEDFMPWYSTYYLVRGAGNFDEPIFKEMARRVEAEERFPEPANEDDKPEAEVLAAIIEAGYTVEPLDEPLYIAI